MPQAPSKPLITEIQFRGNRRIPASTLRARVFSRKGDVYDPNTLDRDFQSLWNTGFLDDIRAEVADAPNGGKIITFFVREKKLVRSIDYKGLSSVQQSDVLDRFREKKVGLTILSQYDPVVIKRAEVVLEELLSEHGRQFASVTARTRNIPPNSVALTFIVVEGPKVKVGAHPLHWQHGFSQSSPGAGDEILQAFRGATLVLLVSQNLRQGQDRLRPRTGPRALPGPRLLPGGGKEPVTKTTDTATRFPFFFWSTGHGKRVDLTVGLEEGNLYHLGRVVIRGNKLFKTEQMSGVLQMKQGDIFNLSKVRKGLENYRKIYGAYGYINFTATPDPEEDPKRHIINLALDFEEGKQSPGSPHRVQR